LDSKFPDFLNKNSSNGVQGLDFIEDFSGVNKKLPKRYLFSFVKRPGLKRQGSVGYRWSICLAHVLKLGGITTFHTIHQT
jgi:hypothetical protein